MTRLRTVFAGTPEFAVPSLEAVLARDDIELVAVYTQPDRPAGRGRRLTPSPVKARAAQAGTEVLQPQRFAAPEVDAFAALGADLLVVAAYGLILPAGVLQAVRYPLNVHASLLPRWRGAAPIQRAIMAGDAETGISIMRVVERLDAGPVWLEQRCPIDVRETGGSLHDKLAALGGVALGAALDALAAGRIRETPQDDALATYAAKIGAADQQLEWADDAVALERRIRALAPRPGARCRLGGVEVKVLAARVANQADRVSPGTVQADPGTLRVAAADRWLEIETLQPAGRQRMDAAAFVNGYGQQL